MGIVQLLLTCGMVIFCVWQTNSLVTTEYEYRNHPIPQAFGGYRIVQVSDSHDKSFGEEQSELIGAIVALRLDAIFLTGDLIDNRRSDLDHALRFVNRMVECAPVYFVAGNHESLAGSYSTFKARSEEAGAAVLGNEQTTLRQGGKTLRLVGLLDPHFAVEENYDGKVGLTNARYEELLSAKGELTILLSHRPELMDLYAFHDVDLVFSGHAHGGQFRFFGRGLFSPSQGLFSQILGRGVYQRRYNDVCASRLGKR